MEASGCALRGPFRALHGAHLVAEALAGRARDYTTPQRGELKVSAPGNWNFPVSLTA